MTCVPGKIRTLRSEETYAQMLEGVSKKEWSSHEVDCYLCRDKLQAGSYNQHLETQHKIYRSKVIHKDLIIKREPVEYSTEPFSAKKFKEEGRGLKCPVEGCPYIAHGKDAPSRMRTHHWDRHFVDTVCVPIIDGRRKGLPKNQ